MGRACAARRDGTSVPTTEPPLIRITDPARNAQLSVRRTLFHDEFVELLRNGRSAG
jgi:hypothetical protein